MDIDIIFKIAARGIAIAVLNQVLIKAGRERTSYADNSCRCHCRAYACDTDDK